VEPIELSAETRVFCQDKRSLTWWAGRILSGPISAEALRSSEDHYSVGFPNGIDALVPTSNIYVRWAHPIEDPTDYLAARITDTPFFFDGRTQIVRYLANQRASFGGLTGLASSAIELLEHQVTTVRQVLSDPIERYLLADEVGLGKTIEAGVLIRQHIIDQPGSARVLIVVPHHLVSQWESELKTKFFLPEDGPVRVIPEEGLLEVANLASKLTMLIVDEAHRVALRAFDADSKQRSYFDALRQVARVVPRVLLLSGTPVLHQEDGFLAMLHLLDADAYPLEQREAFRRRIRDRQMIADATTDLTDDASSLFVDEALDLLEPSCPEDARLAELCAAVRACESDQVDDPKRMKALRALRLHLTEVYRLDRRLLRTRRDDRRVRIHLPQRTGLQVLEYEDHARTQAFDLLESWRLQLLTEATPSDENRRFVTLFSSWVESALCDPRRLLRCLDERLRSCRGDEAEDSESKWAFRSEEKLLREGRVIIADALNADSRTKRLIDWLQASTDAPKALIFVSDREVARVVADQLGAALGSKTVVLHDSARESLERFRQNPDARVLVCDASAEEGLNLQQLRATIVHYDLPLEPGRIEQRIGRIDRLEARGRLRNVALSSGCAYEADWIRCLNDPIEVFNRSIAPLQYALLEATTRIRSELLALGATAFEVEAQRMRDPKLGLNSELRRIKAQEAIDAIEIDPDRDHEFFETLQRADEEAEEGGEAALNAWIVQRLHFARRDAGAHSFRYIYDQRIPTLVPVLEIITRFELSIDRDLGRRQLSREIPLQVATFQRSVAEKTHVSLVRVGHPLISALEDLVRADDRGVAYAMWRQLPRFEGPPRLFFRFDFVVEADVAYAAASARQSRAISKEALRRRADDALPVQYQTVWLNSDLEHVTDPKVVADLALPYSKQRSEDGRRDFNVRRDRWEAVDQLVPIDDWENLCRRGRTKAEASLRESHAFKDRCRSHAEALREAAERTTEALRSRLSRLSGPSHEAEEREANFEAMLSTALATGIEAPSVRADSAGTIFLSSRALFE
jgi:ATP-dependent helicase HepA